MPGRRKEGGEVIAGGGRGVHRDLGWLGHQQSEPQIAKDDQRGDHRYYFIKGPEHAPARNAVSALWLFCLSSGGAVSIGRQSILSPGHVDQFFFQGVPLLSTILRSYPV